MFRAYVEITDDRVLKNIRETLAEAPSLASEALTVTRDEITKFLTEDLFTYAPGPPRYPIRWAPSRHPADRNKRANTRFGYYSRQKAAFFATDGFGRGIPARRNKPAKVNLAWRVEAVSLRAGEALLKVSNTADHFPFVIGDPSRPSWQQQFHVDTGWLTPDEVRETLDQASEDATAVLHREWIRVVRESIYGE